MSRVGRASHNYFLRSAEGPLSQTMKIAVFDVDWLLEAARGVAKLKSRVKSKVIHLHTDSTASLQVGLQTLGWFVALLCDKFPPSGFLSIQLHVETVLSASLGTAL